MFACLWLIYNADTTLFPHDVDVYVYDRKLVQGFFVLDVNYQVLKHQIYGPGLDSGIRSFRYTSNQARIKEVVFIHVVLHAMIAS